MGIWIDRYPNKLSILCISGLATNQCCKLMENQIYKNWKEGAMQAASHYTQKVK